MESPLLLARIREAAAQTAELDAERSALLEFHTRVRADEQELRQRIALEREESAHLGAQLTQNDRVTLENDRAIANLREEIAVSERDAARAARQLDELEDEMLQIEREIAEIEAGMEAFGSQCASLAARVARMECRMHESHAARSRATPDE